MLRPDFAFCHRVLWEQRTGTNLSAAAYAPPVQLRCRVDMKLLPDGSASGSILLPALCGAGPGDRITFEGKTYTLAAVRSARNFAGQESHLEGELK